VMMDSGMRRGTDVLKAIALGASFVFVGRPFLYAAAIAGEMGVRRAAGILTEEINRNMGLLGVSAVGQLDRSRLYRI
jgi:L-lactate dehydrogenase (cytochrome)